MKKWILLILFSWVPVTLLAAVPAVESRAYTTFMVDDFEDGNVTKDPAWWYFGNLNMSVVDNGERTKQTQFNGNKSLHVIANTASYYGGGIGTYLGIDTRRFDSLKLLIFGNGEHSGKIQIELYDDDNGNWKVEQNPHYPSDTAYDDKFTYTLNVDWTGWKVAIVPLSAFVDDNPNIGDNTWNPYQDEKSGGLLQIQLIFLSSQESERTEIKIDELKFFNQNQINTYLDEAERKKDEAHKSMYQDYDFDGYDYGEY